VGLPARSAVRIDVVLMHGARRPTSRRGPAWGRRKHRSARRPSSDTR